MLHIVLPIALLVCVKLEVGYTDQNNCRVIYMWDVLKVEGEVTSRFSAMLIAILI